MKLKLFVLAPLVIGCATQGKGNTTLGIDESQFNKTTLGAIVGAAAGSSLALLVSGGDNAAEAIAIGGIGGGIIGLGVGSQLSKGDSINNSLDEQSIQQREKIKQQERDIDYLRSRNSEQTKSPSHKTKIEKFPSTPPAEVEPQTKIIHDDGMIEESLALTPPPPAHTVTETEKLNAPSTSQSQETKRPTIPAATLNSAPANQPSARGRISGERYPFSTAQPSGTRSPTPFGSQSIAATTTSTSTNSAKLATATPASTPISTSKKDELGKAAAKKESSETTPDIKPLLKKVEPAPTPVVDSTEKVKEKTDVIPAAAKAPIVSSVTPPTTGQGGCREAVKEAEQGLKSSSDADRLFYLRRASRLCPSEPTYHVELGRMLSSLGKSNEAKSELKHALTLEPKNQIARDELGILENSSGKK